MRSIGASGERSDDVGERAAHNALVWPARAIDDRDRAIGAVERRQLRHDLVERVDRKMDRQRRAGRGEGGERFALRHRRGAAAACGSARRDCATSGSVSSRCKRRCGGGESRHAGRDVKGNAELAQPPHLFAHRAPDRQIAGMQPRDVLARPRAPPQSRR